MAATMVDKLDGQTVETMAEWMDTQSADQTAGLLVEHWVATMVGEKVALTVVETAYAKAE